MTGLQKSILESGQQPDVIFKGLVVCLLILLVTMVLLGRKPDHSGNFMKLMTTDEHITKSCLLHFTCLCNLFLVEIFSQSLGFEVKRTQMR